MTPYRKVQAIKNLEVASVCNLACPYCPARLQGEHRETGLMTEETFERSLHWLTRFVKAGTQRELNLFGVGEPLLHPKIVEMAAAVRRIMPRYLSLRMNTNGLLATEEILRGLLEAGVDAIDLTDHEAEASTRTLRTFRKLSKDFPEVKFGYSRDGIMNPNNWGGLIDWVPEVDHPRYLCPWISNGQVMIMSTGDVTRCCQDAFGRGILGTVHDDLEQLDHTPYVQCLTCHEEIPPGIPKPQTEKEATK